MSQPLSSLTPTLDPEKTRDLGVRKGLELPMLFRFIIDVDRDKCYGF